jgi:SAM-dependent methyltransferase
VTEDFNSRYETTDALFGREPERIVTAHANLLPPDGAVLDLGCGQGRHALWLARCGHSVVAVDPSDAAIRTVEARASADRLPITVIRQGFAELADPPAPYAGVLVIGLIQILPPEELDRLVTLIERWTGSGSLLFLVAWTQDDPRYPEIAAAWQPLGRGSFRGPDCRVRTFLPLGHAPQLFPGWEILHHVEELGPWHRHGDEPPERHGRVELVIRRR